MGFFCDISVATSSICLVYVYYYNSAAVLNDTSERKEVVSHFSFLVVAGVAVWGLLQEAVLQMGTITVSQMIQKRLLCCFSIFMHFGRLWFCWVFVCSLKRKLQVIICFNCFAFKKEFYIPKHCNLVYSLTSSVSLHCYFYRMT